MAEQVVDLDLGYDVLFGLRQMLCLPSYSNILCNFVNVCDQIPACSLSPEPTFGQ